MQVFQRPDDFLHTVVIVTQDVAILLELRVRPSTATGIDPGSARISDPLNGQEVGGGLTPPWFV